MGISLKVCVGSSCHLHGAEKVVQIFQEIINSQNLDVGIKLKGSFCLGKCSSKGVTVSINDQAEVIEAEDAESYFYKKIVPLLEK